jgi:hypothetical protein
MLDITHNYKLPHSFIRFRPLSTLPRLLQNALAQYYVIVCLLEFLKLTLAHIRFRFGSLYLPSRGLLLMSTF